MVIINIECAMKQEFLNSWNPKFLEFPHPTRFYQHAHPTRIYVSHATQILKKPPEYTMRNRVQSGRNTKNDGHAHAPSWKHAFPGRPGMHTIELVVHNQNTHPKLTKFT